MSNNIFNEDCVAGMQSRLAENSVDLTVTSIPFEELFTYSGKLEDVGNNGSTIDIKAGRFAQNLQFVIHQLFRVHKPGTNVCIHIQQLLAYKNQHGFAGRRDFRGAVKPGGRGRRQVSLIERTDWNAAMAVVGTDHHWSVRRANLLVDGFDLPQLPGTRLRIGTVLLEITQECDPCSRMEEIEPGLKAALTPDWRGGALARVIEGGIIAVGDTIGVE